MLLSVLKRRPPPLRPFRALGQSRSFADTFSALGNGSQYPAPSTTNGRANYVGYTAFGKDDVPKWDARGNRAKRPSGKPDFLIIDPHPTEAASAQGGGNEGYPDEYAELFTRQNQRRDPELGWACYSGIPMILVWFWFCHSMYITMFWPVTAGDGTLLSRWPIAPSFDP